MDTTLYKLYLYPEQSDAGVGFQCITKTFDNLNDAIFAGDTSDAQFYEVQSITTVITPPSKKFPNGETQITKNLVERKTLKTPKWFQQWIKERNNDDEELEKAVEFKPMKE